MPAQWSFVLTDASGNALAELSTAASRTIQFKRNSYIEVNLTLSHEDDAAGLLLSSLANAGVPKLRAYRRGVNDSTGILRFVGPLAAMQEVSEERSLLTATFRSPFSVLMGDGDKMGRFLSAGAQYLATDAGSIAKALVDTANADAPTGLVTDPSLIVATKVRDRTYPVGQNIGSAVQDLTSVLDGFDFFETFGGTVGAAGAPTNLTANLAALGNLPKETTYYYRVTAVTSTGETVGSNEAYATSVGGSQTITLAWSAVGGASAYRLYRSTTPAGEGNSPALLATIAPGITTYTDDGTIGVSTGAVPSTGAAGIQGDAALNIVASQGAVNPNAPFEYGPTTLANVQSLQRTTTPPQNCIVVTGGNGLSATYTDTTSVAKYGKWWGRADFSTIVDIASLNDKAKGMCRPAPVKTITFVPDLALCPLPFDDWNLGDTVPFRAARSSLIEQTQLRINGFTIPIDENGYETVSVDDVTSPEEDAVLRASLIAEVVVSQIPLS